MKVDVNKAYFEKSDLNSDNMKTSFVVYFTFTLKLKIE